MRQAKSYGIVDHQLLHGKYLHRLSHRALALYLFLVAVSDREGKSFYADRTVEQILRFSSDQLQEARESLIHLGLVDYRRPDWWVKSLTQNKQVESPGPDRQLPAGPPASPGPFSSHLRHIRAILQNLGGCP